MMTVAVMLMLALGDAPAPAPSPTPKPVGAPGPVCRSGEGPRCDCFARDVNREWLWVACPPRTATASTAEAPLASAMSVTDDGLLYVAADSGPALTPTPAADTEPGMSVVTTLGGVVTLAGDAGTTVNPTAFVDVDGPLALGRWAVGRVFVGLGITSAPGESVNVIDVETFRAAKVELGYYHSIGKLTFGDQIITTSIVGGWSFASRMSNGESVPVDRLSRSYGGGLRFDEQRSRANLTLRYGRDEMVGERGWGQWLISGRVPIKGTDGAILLCGDASLMVGPASADPFRQRFTTTNRRDILRFAVVVDPVAAVRAVRN